MKLYFSPGACSLSPHIALREAGLPFELEQVNLRTKQTKDGSDYRAINPKGQVPVLKLDDGQLLTEGPAIVQFIADQKPQSKLAPANGTIERYRLQEWLNHITSELHKSFTPLFNSKTVPETKAAFIEAIGGRFDLISKHLENRQYLMGDTFTVADGYLFTILNWTGHVGIDLAKWPVLKAYQARVAARPAVHAALVAEGLVK